ncbi:MAG: secretion system protein [Methanomicrobiales archaeon]|nr:secretion system protein [Methanomicrobiales archaeon]
MALPAVFGEWVAWDPARLGELRRALVQAQAGITPGRYLRRCAVFAAGAGVAAGVAGFLAAGYLWLPELSLHIYNVFSIRPPAVDAAGLSSTAIRLLVALLFLLIGTWAGWRAAWAYPAVRARLRSGKITLTMHHAVAYMYAMRQGGAELPDIIRSLASHPEIYGEIAREFKRIVRDTEYFGDDLITAIRSLRNTTPSEKLKDFLEDLLAVIESGGDVSAFLASRIRLYQDTARFDQRQYLTTLQLVAESYVTVFVAGPLFLIIVMVVLGMLGSNAVFQLSLVGYAFIPAGSLIFILIVWFLGIREERPSRYRSMTELAVFAAVPLRAADADDANTGRLKAYDRQKRLFAVLKNPFGSFVLSPARTFAVTVPCALAYTAMTVYSVLAGGYGDYAVGIIDDHLVIAALFILAPYAFFSGLASRRAAGIEAGIPDFLDRLGSMNRVGLTLAQSIEVLVRSNLGVISTEIRRIQRDIDWGATVADALVRFEERVHTLAIARTVTLITRATRMSGNIGDVLAIAAGDAKMNMALKRDRLSEMVVYTAIIYLAFLVFVFVIIIIDIRFLTLLEGLSAGGTAAAGTGIGLSAVPVYAIRQILFHTCILQAFFSGIIAGQMGEGSVRAGVKHAAVMMLVALIGFAVFI